MTWLVYMLRSILQYDVPAPRPPCAHAAHARPLRGFELDGVPQGVPAALGPGARGRCCGGF